MDSNFEYKVIKYIKTLDSHRYGKNLQLTIKPECQLLSGGSVPHRQVSTAILTSQRSQRNRNQEGILGLKKLGEGLPQERSLWSPLRSEVGRGEHGCSSQAEPWERY